MQTLLAFFGWCLDSTLNIVFSAFQGGQTGPLGPPAAPPSFRPEDELEHLTKKMLYDMENPPADEYFGEWGLGLTSDIKVLFCFP